MENVTFFLISSKIKEIASRLCQKMQLDGQRETN